ncbi:hypothetical protein CCP2SC5_2570001 [Azospirillaceae bacterium]
MCSHAGLAFGRLAGDCSGEHDGSVEILQAGRKLFERYVTERRQGCAGSCGGANGGAGACGQREIAHDILFQHVFRLDYSDACGGFKVARNLIRWIDADEKKRASMDHRSQISSGLFWESNHTNKLK